MVYLLHTFEPQAILATVGPFTIHWYGAIITIGAVLGIVATARLAARYGIDADQIYSLSFWLLFCGIIGARLYYVLYAWEYYGSHPADIVKIWEGGLAIHGGIIAGVSVLLVFAKKHVLSWALLADCAAVGIVTGQIIGRWGNYFNQELFGRPTDAPWGIPIVPQLRPTGFEDVQYFHPTFLYESLLNFCVLGLLLVLHHRQLKKSPGQRRYGDIALWYLVCYSAVRFSMEFLRLDYSPVVLGIRWAQLLSACIIVGALGLLGYRHYARKPLPDRL